MRKIFLAMAAVLLLASACGDDSSAGGGRFEAAAGGDTASSGDGGEAVGAGSGGDFCGLSADINDGLDAVNVFGGPDSVEAAFRQIADNIDRATGQAPAELREDVQLLSEGVAGFIDVLEEYDYNFLAIPDDAVTTDPRLAAVESPEYEAASDRVNAYCGIEPDPGLDASDTEPPVDEPGADGGGVPDFGDAGLDSDFLVQIYQDAFGWDAELAACVVEELGLEDPTGAVDPSVFSDGGDGICGRTWDELFAGG